MQEIQSHVIQLAKQSNKSNSQIARESGIGESTVRRFMNGEDSSVNTLTKIAAVVGATTDDLLSYIPQKTAIAIEMVKQEMEQEFKPHSPHCATDCPARIDSRQNLEHIEALYEARLAEHTSMYERAIASAKKRERILSICLIVLGILFAFNSVR